MTQKIDIPIIVKGGGEVGTAVVHRLARCHFRVCISEIASPLAVTRDAAFCEAIYEGQQTVEGVTAVRVISADQIPGVWKSGHVPIIVAPSEQIRQVVQADVLVDAIMAKKNTGTRLTDAPFVIGLGPGFRAGKDAHAVIETNNSNNLGRVIVDGEAEANTGIPIPVGGYSYRRVFHPPVDGRFTSDKKIGIPVKPGDIIGYVDERPISAEIGGVLRGLIRSGVKVKKDTKLAEIDPLCRPEDCGLIRALPRAIGGGVLEAILNRFNLG
ncbi:MAG: EF2563 family selenium-dependent molybdenum hydroxylase system protein [Chloroflexi bacterium]|nr:EF2563 family selenium-dependent molybdenum hydroxylase system protein [Chloroflexota bacterium]